MAEEKEQLSRLLEQAMKDPAVLSLAQSLMSGGASGGTDNGAASAVTASAPMPTGLPADVAAKLPELLPSLTSAVGVGSPSEEVERRNRLLSALKPYLSGNRRDVIDKIMSVSKLTTLLDLMPGSGK